MTTITPPTIEEIFTYFQNGPQGKALIEDARLDEGFYIQSPNGYSSSDLHGDKVLLEKRVQGSWAYVNRNNTTISSFGNKTPLESGYAVISAHDSPPKDSLDESTNENKPIGCWQRLSDIWACVVRAFKALLNCFCCCRSKQEIEPSKPRNTEPSPLKPIPTEPPASVSSSVSTVLKTDQPSELSPVSTHTPPSLTIENTPPSSSESTTTHSTSLIPIPEVTLDKSSPLPVSSSSASQSSSTSIQSTSSTQKASTQPPTLVPSALAIPVIPVLDKEQIERSKILFLFEPSLRGTKDCMDKITQTVGVMEKITSMIENDKNIIPFACYDFSLQKEHLLKSPAPSGQVRIILKPLPSRLQADEWNNTTARVQANYTILFDPITVDLTDTLQNVKPTSSISSGALTIPCQIILINQKRCVIEQDNVNNANTRNALNAMILEKLS